MASYVDVLSGMDRSIQGRLLRVAAWFASKLYSAISSVRNLAYRRGWFVSHKLAVPVISVGNLTVGGTGKTPTVALVCRKLRRQGYRVAIVSRGYGAGADGLNDEALELEMQLPDVPHLQNPDRVAAATVAVEELESQVVVMDDGFQHRRLQRDFDIVLLDATEPFGFGHVLPRGLLREPIRALRRANAVIVTRCDQVDQQRLADIRRVVQRESPNAVWSEGEHRPTQLRNSAGEIQDLSYLKGQACVLFCGIGNPLAFQATVKSLGAQICDFIEFPDHHRYSAEDIADLRERLERVALKEPERKVMILCTGKDLAKISVTEIAGAPLYALDIELYLRFGEEAFDDRLSQVVQSYSSLLDD